MSAGAGTEGAVHPNEALLRAFYQGFRWRDAEAMAACYTPDATFSDPVFQHLRGAEVPAMWRMLAGRARDLTVVYRVVRADDTRGQARWEATYSYGTARRMVHNVIHSTFRFKDGKIVAQRDRFNLWRWSRMALGLRGALLGWLPPVRGAIRREASKSLDAYMTAQSSASHTL
jgi:ketosteroid isomerase-like protein